MTTNAETWPPVTRYRWNADARRWEFFNASWGGWCILRQTPSDASPPMDRAEGETHMAKSRAWYGDAKVQVVEHGATKDEPTRADAPTGRQPEAGEA